MFPRRLNYSIQKLALVRPRHHALLFKPSFDTKDTEDTKERADMKDTKDTTEDRTQIAPALSSLEQSDLLTAKISSTANIAQIHGFV